MSLPTIRASDPPRNDRLSLTATAPVEFVAAADDGEGEKRRPTFEILGYTGAPMSLGGFYDPVIVDLDGVGSDRPRIPILLDHDPGKIVGQATFAVGPEGITLSGTVTDDEEYGPRVVMHARNGFEWQASIGASIARQEYLKEGARATVNGREVTGPMLIARQVVLKETSFVAIGADSQTAATVAASNPLGIHQGSAMNFDQWLQAKGFDPTALSDIQKATLRAAFDAEQAPPAQQAPQQPAGNGGNTNPNSVTANAARSLEQVFADARAEEDRIAEITRITADAINDRPGLMATLQAMSAAAVEARSSPAEYELNVLRATRAPAPAIARGRDQQATAKVIEAAICLHGGLVDAEKQFDEKTLEAADSRFRHGLGLRDLLVIAAKENGYNGTTAGNLDELFRAAFGRDERGIRAASGFSTMSLSGILSNTANKFLRQGFDSIETGWNRIAAMRSVRDFKQSTSYTLTGGFTFEQVGPAGELKHATVGEESYTNQADTYGRMFAITRKNIINDDLGALTEVPFRIGRGAALKLNTVFWTEFLEGVTTFYTTGRGNYFEGSSTNLQSSSLVTATQMFRKQTDPDGNPLGVAPRILLVPPELEITADELMTSTVVNTGGSSSTDRVPNRNVWQSKYEVVMSTYLSNTGITNYSTTAWFLLANPMDLPVIEVAFLNGRQRPVVESADADFNTLGIQMRGYFDFGVNKQEYRAGVRSKGAA